MQLTTEQRTQLQTRGGAIYRTALQETRKLTDSEQTELRAIEMKLDQAEYETANPPTESSEAQRRFTSGMETRSRELRAGEVRILSNKDRLSDHVPDANSEMSIGAIVRAKALGNNNRLNEAELRILNEGTGSAGGFTVPTPLSARLIDLARNKTRVIQAGAQTVVMSDSTLKMARQASDPTAAWKTENAVDGGASDISFEQLTFSAQSLVARGKMSVELFEDGQNIDAIVSNSLASALALELDRVALAGSGTPPQPRGVKNQSGINTLSAGGALTSYAKLIAAYQSLLEDNQQPTGLIYSPRVWAQLEGLTDQNDNPLMVPSSIAALPRFITNQVADNGSPQTSETAYMADWSQLMIGMRTNITLEVSRVATDASTSAFNSMQVFFRAYLRADIQLAHAPAFVTISGITA